MHALTGYFTRCGMLIKTQTVLLYSSHEGASLHAINCESVWWCLGAVAKGGVYCMPLCFLNISMKLVLRLGPICIHKDSICFFSSSIVALGVMVCVHA